MENNSAVFEAEYLPNMRLERYPTLRGKIRPPPSPKKRPMQIGPTKTRQYTTDEKSTA